MNENRSNDVCRFINMSSFLMVSIPFFFKLGTIVVKNVEYSNTVYGGEALQRTSVPY